MPRRNQGLYRLHLVARCFSLRFALLSRQPVGQRLRACLKSGAGTRFGRAKLLLSLGPGSVRGSAGASPSRIKHALRAFPPGPRGRVPLLTSVLRWVTIRSWLWSARLNLGEPSCDGIVETDIAKTNLLQPVDGRRALSVRRMRSRTDHDDGHARCTRLAYQRGPRRRPDAARPIHYGSDQRSLWR